MSAIVDSSALSSALRTRGSRAARARTLRAARSASSGRSAAARRRALFAPMQLLGDARAPLRRRDAVLVAGDEQHRRLDALDRGRAAPRPAPRSCARSRPASWRIRLSRTKATASGERWRVSAEIATLTRPSAISCMPAVPSPRALAARARIAARAASGGAISGPNRAMLAHQLRRRRREVLADDRAERVADPVRARHVQPRADREQRLDEALDRERAPRPAASDRCPACRRGSRGAAPAPASSGVKVLRAAAEAVHADDGVALAFFLDDDRDRSTCSVMASVSLNRFSIAPMPSISIRTTSPPTSQLRRLEAHADARRRAGGDHVAGVERDAARAGLDQRRDVEDHVARVAVLAQLAVDPAAHAAWRGRRARRRW